jgi:hypothetical protein
MFIHPPAVAERLAASLPSFNDLKLQGSVYVSEVIPREYLPLSRDFVPWAPGVVVASETLLQTCGCGRGTRALKGWREVRPDEFHKKANPLNLYVGACGDFWGIERQNYEALVFDAASLPIFTKTKEDAMRLAVACQTNFTGSPVLPLALVRWVPSEPGAYMYS